MVLSDVLGPIRRRWYILLLGFVLAGGIGWATAVLAPSQYTARGLVMLLPSTLTTGPKGNPLLNLGGLELPARVLIAYYSSEPAQSDLEKSAPKAEVQVSMEESTRGPIIAVDVKDVTAEGALRILHHVADSIPENLSRIQTDVGTSKQAAIRSLPLVLDSDAERDISLMVRLVVASTVATLALAFFVVFSVDGILLRRANAAEADESEQVEDGAETDSATAVNEDATAVGRASDDEGGEPIVSTTEAVSADVDDTVDGSLEEQTADDAIRQTDSGEDGDGAAVAHNEGSTTESSDVASPSPPPNPTEGRRVRRSAALMSDPAGSGHRILVEDVEDDPADADAARA